MSFWTAHGSRSPFGGDSATHTGGVRAGHATDLADVRTVAAPVSSGEDADADRTGAVGQRHLVARPAA